MADNPFEISQALRDVSEQNLKQARAAYEQLVNFMISLRQPLPRGGRQSPSMGSVGDALRQCHGGEL